MHEWTRKYIYTVVKTRGERDLERREHCIKHVREIV